MASPADFAHRTLYAITSASVLVRGESKASAALRSGYIVPIDSDMPVEITATVGGASVFEMREL